QYVFFISSRRRHTRSKRDWSSDVCSSDLLDQPLYVQLGRYMAYMLRGDFGVSYSVAKNISINSILAVRLPVSIRIGGQAVVVGEIGIASWRGGGGMGGRSELGQN